MNSTTTIQSQIDRLVALKNNAKTPLQFEPTIDETIAKLKIAKAAFKTAEEALYAATTLLDEILFGAH